MLGLATNGLIKIKSNITLGATDLIRDFCEHFGICVQQRLNNFADVHCICAGRTLLKDNAYLNEVLPKAQFDAATKLAVIALTSSYYKEYLPEGSKLREKMTQLEMQSVARTTDLFQRDAPDAARMLMIHHAILNPNMHEKHWSDYLYQLQDSPGQQTNLVIARHSIWLMTILPLADKYRFQTYDYSWVGCGEENGLTKVNGILGTSRKMLYFQQLITVAARVSTAGLLSIN